MNINIQPTSETKALINKLQSGSGARSAIRAGLKRGSNIFQSEAMQFAPVNTSNLRRNIKTRVGSEQAEIYNDLKYAIYQEEGTGIYGKRGAYITPKRAKFLRFKSKTGKIVYAKRVKGTKATKFFYKAGESLKRRIGEVNNIIYVELQKILFN